MKIHAVYSIENITNNKVYIGSAIDIKSRFRQHKSDLNLNKHTNLLLQRAWNKYGNDKFVFITIEEIQNPKELIVREQFWINKFFSSERLFGYNIREIAASNLGMIRSDETKAKISASKKGQGLGAKRSMETRQKIKNHWVERNEKFFSQFTEVISY